MIFKSLRKVSFVSNIEITKIVCNHTSQQLILQVDGEFFVTNEQIISIAVLPKALHVIT
jgi:hypothetical protein